MNIDAGDLINALTNQRNAAMQEAAMNYAMAVGLERKVKELEAKLNGDNNDEKVPAPGIRVPSE